MTSQKPSERIAQQCCRETRAGILGDSQITAIAIRLHATIAELDRMSETLSPQPLSDTARMELARQRIEHQLKAQRDYLAAVGEVDVTQTEVLLRVVVELQAEIDEVRDIVGRLAEQFARMEPSR